MGLKPFSVGQVNNYIGRILKTDPILGNISVIGEISNLTFHKSGYVFFSLKEDKSRLKCIIAPWNVEKITCPLEEGMEVIASGFISVFERDGVYNLNVRDIETNGIGQLAVAFEKLKAKLEKEGLFRKTRSRCLRFLQRSLLLHLRQVLRSGISSKQSKIKMIM